jgi:hypothetical protein
MQYWTPSHSPLQQRVGSPLFGGKPAATHAVHVCVQQISEPQQSGLVLHASPSARQQCTIGLLLESEQSSVAVGSGDEQQGVPGSQPS